MKEKRNKEGEDICWHENQRRLPVRTRNKD
jgi:hypothetical protein